MQRSFHRCLPFGNLGQTILGYYTAWARTAMHRLQIQRKLESRSHRSGMIVYSRRVSIPCELPACRMDRLARRVWDSGGVETSLFLSGHRSARNWLRRRSTGPGGGDFARGSSMPHLPSFCRARRWHCPRIRGVRAKLYYPRREDAAEWTANRLARFFGWSSRCGRTHRPIRDRFPSSNRLPIEA